MPDVERFSNFRAPIREGYFPKLDTLVANRAWPARPDGAVLSSLNRVAQGINLDIATVEQWRDRIVQAIESGFATNSNGQRIPLDEANGIEMLGNMMVGLKFEGRNGSFTLNFYRSHRFCRQTNNSTETFTINCTTSFPTLMTQTIAILNPSE